MSLGILGFMDVYGCLCMFMVDTWTLQVTIKKTTNNNSDNNYDHDTNHNGKGTTMWPCPMISLFDKPN